MRIGYARVSTDDQTLDLQRDALKKAKCREIHEEQASGKNTALAQIEACLKALREGDTRSPTGQLVFHIFGALAEFERNLIRERTLADLNAARARGRKGGRPRNLSPQDALPQRRRHASAYMMGRFLRQARIPLTSPREKHYE